MSMFKWFKAQIRGYFLAGLLVLVPLGVTAAVITAILRLIDRLLVIIPPKFHPHTYLHFKIPGFGLVLAIVLIMITGVLVKNYIGRRVVDFGEYILSGIPLVRPVYVAVKQVIHAMFGDTPYAFKRAILVEYPRRGVWALAFVTGKTYGEIEEKTEKKTINVFLPTTPNPTSGFYLVVPEEDTISLDIGVEDAFKLLISGGVVEPGGKVSQFPFGRKQRNARMQEVLRQSVKPETPPPGSGKSDGQSEEAEKVTAQTEDRSLGPAGKRNTESSSAEETDMPES
jgi:uncharacterized membrane protein